MDRRSFMRGAVIAASTPTIALAPALIDKRSAEDRLRAAAADVRSAMKELGVESYMVMIREESSSVAKRMDFNRDGTLHRLLELG